MHLNDIHLRTDQDWANHLLRWYDAHKRDFPWRRKVSTYHTWICEVMSQQTTMAVVVPRFLKFIETLPTVETLASASDEVLRELWAGLGYYARARNLRAGACYIVSKLNGQFPDTYEDWLKVPGVGPYTASVICSICFSLPKGCVDGNVMRVMARLTSCSLPEIWSEEGRSVVQGLVDSVITPERPGDFNQAMMELGATVCQKRNPECKVCPVQEWCLARADGIVEQCPPNKPRKGFVDVQLLAVRISLSQGWDASEAMLLVERSEGFLSGTVGFPLVRCSHESSIHDLCVEWAQSPMVEDIKLIERSISHTITNHKISVRVAQVHLKGDSPVGARQEVFAEKALNLISTSASRAIWVSKSHAPKSLATSLDRKIWEKFS